MRLSIIIPTYFEEDNIGELLDFLTQHPNHDQSEIIVVDGGSKDDTLAIISKYSSVRLVQSEVASRPVQMNLGAANATGEVLYFVHADVRLPHSFLEDINESISSFPAGVYKYQFNSPRWLLKINAYFTRFPMMWCRGGDQTLYITRALFEQLGGFDDYFCVLEDFDLLTRIKAVTPFAIMPGEVIVSARKYAHNNYFKVQWANLMAFRKYRKGVNPIEIRQFYKHTLGLKHY
ncbi:MAG: TIGR04283 family arsenosugar biosynthesis glycosyltransferase [Cyclobacteriaceae bacterium]